ncbi:3-dehydroquinate synthase [Feifania hominis]|uniref:3-dehydroquinate synthase n=1 Tax=Feifania hominis TaxID=2763660 RepID=A0A926DCM4_9FIRM|nr:3-dehydroquinate synthase [Feifania hominis]MBC8535417.1 3-dehydroquinate synthase [Feifania hominis]
MTTISCAGFDHPYEIIIESGCFARVAHTALPLVSGRRVAVVTDSNVAGLYAGGLLAGLEAAGFQTHLFVFPAGEQSKTLDTIGQLYRFLSENGLTRSDLLCALGGGVTGDMTGFASATYLRGIPYVQIPTTLLSQVDSSVGGKTGVDTPFGKNLVGAFHNPVAVLIDPELLTTLPRVFFEDGLGEVIKYAAIRDAAMEQLLLERPHGEALEALIARCVAIKRDVVEADPLDTGLRGILNFGHTLGHAEEKLSNFSGYTHGQAVAAGMVAAAAIGERLGVTEAGTRAQLVRLLERHNLPTALTHSADELFEAALHDKKNLSGSLSLILLRRFGEAVIHPIPVEDFHSLLRQCL